MARKTRSIRGEIVDFDLFDIKKQMQNAPITTDVKKRENFIDKKRRRNVKNVINTLIANKPPTAVDSVASVESTEVNLAVDTPTTKPAQQIIKK